MLTDAVLIAIYAALAMLVVGTTVSSAVHGIYQKLSKAYLGISACLLGWLSVTCAYHIATNPKLVAYLENLAFVFIAFMPVILLTFVSSFYRVKQHINTKAFSLLCIIPAITAVISVIPSLNWLLRVNYAIIQLSPLHITTYDWNIWFYVHLIYSYLLLGLTGFLILWQFHKQPTGYKFPSALLLSGILIIYLSDLSLFRVTNSAMDNTLVGGCIFMVIVYFAIINNPEIEFISSARKALYNNLDIPVYIVDKLDYVLDMNWAARNMLKKVGRIPDSSSFPFQDILNAISDIGGVFQNGYVHDDVGHILININSKTVVLRQVRRKLVDHKGRLLGSYIALMDITNLHRIIDDLQYKAEVDPLTGIPNRRAYEQKRTELDVPENLPLSFIVGDVNRLKQVNDQQGHKHGDMLLKTVAGILTGACPQDGFCARIGGDEFVLVLPCCDSEGAQVVVDDIHIQLKGVEAQFFGASIALGHITKTKPEQDIQELVHQADQLMYSQKKYDRRRSG